MRAPGGEFRSMACERRKSRSAEARSCWFRQVSSTQALEHTVEIFKGIHGCIFSSACRLSRDYHINNITMSSWFTDIASSHKLQLGLTAVVSGCLAASAVVGLQEARRRYEVYDLKGSIPDLDAPHDVERVRIYAGDFLKPTLTDW